MLQKAPYNGSLDPTGQSFKADHDVALDLRQRIEQFGMQKLCEAANVSYSSLKRYKRAGTLPDTGAGHRVAYALLLRTSASIADDGGIKVDLPVETNGSNGYDYGITDDEAINAKRKADAQYSREKVRKIKLEIAIQERRLIGVDEINSIMLAQARRWREQIDTTRRAIERVTSADCRAIVVKTFDINMELTRKLLKGQWRKLDDGGYKPPPVDDDGDGDAV